MKRYLRAFAMAAPLFVAMPAGPALAQKPGGILKMYSPDSPASMSVHEEATFVAEGPMMGVFNNLVMFDQHAKQNSLGSIVPDLATGWSWNEDGTELTLPLREGVRWHDGKPLTAKDVQCTFDLVTGKSSEKLPPCLRHTICSIPRRSGITRPGTRGGSAAVQARTRHGATPGGGR